jgi:hypothetical protein
MSDEEVLDEIPENDSPEQEAPETEAQSEVADAPVQEQAPAAPQPTVWDAFKSLPDFKGADERAIAQRLYQSLEREKQSTHALAQYQQILPYAQEYLQHRPEFDKWRAAQQQATVAPPTAAPAPKENPFWNPPQLRDAYKRYIVKDENGRDTISPDAPLDAKHAITEFFQYKQDFADRFLSNPEEALAPLLSKYASEQAQQIVQERLEEAGRQQYVQTLEQSNKDWLYDKNGNVSKEGEAARTYIEQAKAMGISTPEARWDFALKMVERDLLQQVQQAQVVQAQRQAFQQQLSAAPQGVIPTAPQPTPQPQQSQAEANMEYLRRAASRTANRAGVTTNSPEAGRKGMSFAEHLRSTLSEDGLIG